MKKKFMFGLLALAFTIIPFFAFAQTPNTADLLAEITRLQALISRLTEQLNQQRNNQSNWCYNFNNNLAAGSSGNEVATLHTALTREGFRVPTGDRFSQTTAAAVSEFQLKYRGEILTPLGLSVPTGYLGASTRAKLNRLYGCGVVRPITQLRIISPNGGETWTKGTNRLITWTPVNPNSEVRISLMAYSAHEQCIADGGTICPMDISVVYPIDQASNTGSYMWPVGRVASQGIGDGTAHEGRYWLNICEVGTSECDRSDQTFDIVRSNTGNLPPVIHGVSGPTTLADGQTGTWTVNASDPENGNLTYTVRWGDEPVPIALNALPYPLEIFQTAILTHTYNRAGNFNPTFTVTDDSGQSARTSLSVTISQPQQKDITVLSPNGGESWISNSVQPLRWSVRSGSNVSRVDLYL